MIAPKQADAERKKIDDLLASGKIGPDDHRLLIDALERKSSRLYQVFLNVTNPFRIVSGVSVLILGLFFVGGSSFLAPVVGLGFPAIFSIQLMHEGMRMPTGLENFADNLVNVISLAGIFYIGARVSRKRNLRIMDFVGTMAFSTFPLLIIVLIHLAAETLFPNVLSKNQTAPPSLPQMIFFGTITILPIWQMILVFSGLKESSGLKGTALWITFVAGTFLAIMASINLNLFIARGF